jgi:acetyltransferase
VGYGVLKNIIDAGYKGLIYPVNPQASKILGLRCYPSLADIDSPIDLVVIVLPAPAVIDAVRMAGEKGVKACVVISAGFRESGAEGAKREAELVRVANSFGVRIIGPNCLGIIDTASHLNATFAASCPKKGRIAFFSQSGALCTAILDWAEQEEIGFSKFVSLGNKADIDETDLIKSLGEDSETDVILGYIEDVKNGTRFMEVASTVSRKKPLIMIKSGTTAAGARAASSHTGALAGSEAAFRTAFAQCGIIRATSVENLFDLALIFASGKRTTGKRVAVVTNAGGPGIIAADAIEKSGLVITSFESDTINRLRKALPYTAAVYNPVDVIGDADEKRYKAALTNVVEDPNVDMICVILTPQVSTRPLKTAMVINEVAANTGKPVVTCFMGGPAVRKGIIYLEKHGIPNYPFPERAATAMSAMAEFCARQKLEQVKIERIPIDIEGARKIMEEAKKAGEIDIADSRARAILKAYGFHVPKSEIAIDDEEAVKIAQKIGFPVAMKIASPDVLHKSDIGAVKINLRDEKDVRTAFTEIVNNTRQWMPDARIMGVTVQEMIPHGCDIIIGMSKDPQFGPMVMVGLGGIHVEVMKDVTFRIAPLSRDDAISMLTELRAYPILRGIRGEKPVDMDSLVNSIVMLSQFVCDFPEIVEMDINPLRVFHGQKGAIAIDVRITIREGQK